MAATPIYQANSGIQTHKSIASLYDKTFDKIVKIKESVPRESARFFSMRNTNLETYKEGQVSSVLEVPHRNEDTDRVPLMSPAEGYYKSFTNIQRRSGIIVTKRAIRTQKHQMIAQMMTGLPNSFLRLEELSMAKLLNDGFATETTGDGSYIFATDHYYENPEFGQWSNLGTAGSFTTSSFLEAWLNMQNRKNERGFTDFKIPGEVYYPPAAHEAVMKVHGSDQYPQNSLNAKMPELFGAFEPVLGHWLLSSTAWFVHAKCDDAEKGFLFVWELPTEYSPLSDGMNPGLVMGKMGECAFSVGALHGKDWVGNAGA